jgi:transcriptional regulator with XRE-family HTH domain
MTLAIRAGTIAAVPPRATPHPYLKKLGARIREFREAKGWNQERFAAEAGIDRSYAHGLERGVRNITILKLLQIAKTLGVKMTAFFDLE